MLGVLAPVSGTGGMSWTSLLVVSCGFCLDFLFAGEGGGMVVEFAI